MNNQSISALVQTIKAAATRPVASPSIVPDLPRPALPVTLQAVQEHLERSAQHLENAAECFEGLKLFGQAGLFRKQAHQTRHLIVRIGG